MSLILFVLACFSPIDPLGACEICDTTIDSVADGCPDNCADCVDTCD